MTKTRFFRRAFIRILLIASLGVTAACTGINKVSTPTKVSPTVKPSPTLTLKPTQTFTPEPTQTPTLAPTPTPPESPGTFEGVGTITSVEQHDGKWYGIDTLGRAEIVQDKTGAWVKYDRPVEIVIDSATQGAGGVPAVLLKDLDQSKITRLKDGENPLPWGIVEEDHPYKDNPFAQVYISGYPLGFFDITFNNITARFLPFETPFKYNDQVIVYCLPGFPGQSSGFLLSTYSIPSPGDIQKRVLSPLDDHGLMLMMSNPKIVGHQMVLALQINSGQAPGAIPFDGQDDETLNMIANSINTGNAVSAEVRITLTTIGAWVEESFFEK